MLIVDIGLTGFSFNEKESGNSSNSISGILFAYHLTRSDKHVDVLTFFTALSREFDRIIRYALIQICFAVNDIQLAFDASAGD